MAVVISSESNEKVKNLRKLYHKRQRKKEGKFILEGYRIIDEAFKAGAVIESIFMTPEFASGEEGRDIIGRINNREAVNLLEDILLKKISDTDTPQGIIAVAREVNYNPEDMFREAQIILVLDRIQDPGNMGTIIRTAVAAGADGIISLKGCVDIYNLKVLRSTMGAIFNIPVLHMDLAEFKEVIIEKSRDFEVVGTGLSGNRYHYEPTYSKPVMLIIGNEACGVRDDLLKLSDYIVKIPIIGRIDSLNVAVATGIILYRIVEEKNLANG